MSLYDSNGFNYKGVGLKYLIDKASDNTVFDGNPFAYINKTTVSTDIKAANFGYEYYGVDLSNRFFVKYYNYLINTDVDFSAFNYIKIILIGGGGKGGTGGNSSPNYAISGGKGGYGGNGGSGSVSLTISNVGTCKVYIGGAGAGGDGNGGNTYISINNITYRANGGTKGSNGGNYVIEYNYIAPNGDDGSDGDISNLESYTLPTDKGNGGEGGGPGSTDGDNNESAGFSGVNGQPGFATIYFYRT